jgi:hypothetical protein
MIVLSDGKPNDFRLALIFFDAAPVAVGPASCYPGLDGETSA